MFLSWWNGQYLEGKNWENNECIVQKSECNGIVFIGGYSISPAFDKTAPGYLAPLHIALTLAPEVMMAINSEKTIPLIFFVFVFVSAFVFVIHLSLSLSMSLYLHLSLSLSFDLYCSDLNWSVHLVLSISSILTEPRKVWKFQRVTLQVFKKSNLAFEIFLPESQWRASGTHLVWSNSWNPTTGKATSSESCLHAILPLPPWFSKQGWSSLQCLASPHDEETLGYPQPKSRFQKGPHVTIHDLSFPFQAQWQWQEKKWLVTLWQ